MSSGELTSPKGPQDTEEVQPVHSECSDPCVVTSSSLCCRICQDDRDSEGQYCNTMLYYVGVSI